MAYTAATQRYQGRTPRARAPGRKLGTWKMAYADFLTALMAFFLLMWLVNGVTPEDRSALADYFNGDSKSVAISSSHEDIAALARLIEDDPILANDGANVMITTTPTHIRINLMDASESPLFDSGNGLLNEKGRKLTIAAGRAIRAFRFPVTVEGHTDAFPSTIPDYSNWELSSARANAARRAIEDAGVDPARIRSVSGLADTVPLNPGEPHKAANRRISIILDISGKARENHIRDK